MPYSSSVCENFFGTAGQMSCVKSCYAGHSSHNGGHWPGWEELILPLLASIRATIFQNLVALLQHFTCPSYSYIEFFDKNMVAQREIDFQNLVALSPFIGAPGLRAIGFFSACWLYMSYVLNNVVDWAYVGSTFKFLRRTCPADWHVFTDTVAAIKYYLLKKSTWKAHGLCLQTKQYIPWCLAKRAKHNFLLDWFSPTHFEFNIPGIGKIVKKSLFPFIIVQEC